MADVELITPQQFQERQQAGEEMLLVCAYDSDEKFRQNHLEGALSLDDFRSRLDSIPKDRSIVFY